MRLDAQDCGRYRQLENGIMIDWWTVYRFEFKRRSSRRLTAADPGLDGDWNNSEFVQTHITMLRFDSGTRQIKQKWI
jgi:hypothetical protein